MTGLEFPLALFLLANLMPALWSILRRPNPADPMLVALLFGSTGVGILVLLAYSGAGPALVDIALVLALLAAISGIAFARRAWHSREDDHD